MVSVDNSYWQVKYTDIYLTYTIYILPSVLIIIFVLSHSNPYSITITINIIIVTVIGGNLFIHIKKYLRKCGSK